MSIALYDLSEAYQNILSLIDEENPDTDLTQALAVIEGQIEVKAVNIANLIKSIDVEVEAIKAEEQRLKQRRESRENAIVSIKDYLKSNLESLKMDKIKTPTRTVYIQNNPWSAEIQDEKLIPDEYFVVKKELSKSKVKDALTEGKEVPGAILTRGRSLRIR